MATTSRPGSSTTQFVFQGVQSTRQRRHLTVLLPITADSTGKERDQESGLDYFGARYYSAAQGRFTSPDPLMASARISDPQTWNRYSYALNNPLRLVDPDGMNACDSQKKECVHVNVNVIFDKNANKGKGLTDEQKKQIKQDILTKAQKQFGTSNVDLNLSYTAGKMNVSESGNVSFEGLQKGALNLFVTSGAPLGMAGGAAGGSGKTNGMYLTAVDVSNSEFDDQTVPHELAHQFLGDPDRKPNPDALTDAMIHIFREGDIAVRNTAQRHGVSQSDYREGAKKFTVQPTQDNVRPTQR